MSHRLEYRRAWYLHYFDNKMVQAIIGVKLEVSVLFGFRKTIVDGTRKREIARQVYLNRANLSFYCNSHTAILNPQRPRETQFLRKLFARPAFSRKSGQYCVAWLYQLLVAGDRSGVECGEFSAQVAVVAGNGDHCGVICGKF